MEMEILTSDSELVAICELYWEVNEDFEFVHKVAELAELVQVEKYKIPYFIKDLCNVYMPNWKCKDCGKPYIFMNRSDFLQKRKHLQNDQIYSFICSECQQFRRKIETAKQRQQEENAKQEKQKADELMREKIRIKFDLSKRPYTDTSTLSLKDLVFLYSILVAGAYEDLSKIMPAAMFEKPLTPSVEYTSQIINYLVDNNLIFVHPDTRVEAFAKDDLSQFYIWRVYYAPPISKRDPNNPKAVIQEILKYINGTWPEEWYEEAIEIWNRIALEECREYLLFVLNEHHFEFNPGEKTDQYLSYALQYFSTAQVFNIIWSGAKDAAAYYQRGGVSKMHAVNSAISYIQRQSERVLAEGWKLKPFNRNFKCPQSIISSIFYNTVLRIGEAGFQTNPNFDYLKENRLAIDFEDDDNTLWG